jgi:hypothetical protein
MGLRALSSCSGFGRLIGSEQIERLGHGAMFVPGGLVVGVMSRCWFFLLCRLHYDFRLGSGRYLAVFATGIAIGICVVAEDVDGTFAARDAEHARGGPGHEVVLVIVHLIVDEEL